MKFPINNATSKNLYNSIYRERYSFKRYTDQLATGYGILVSQQFLTEPVKEVYYKLGDIEAERLAKEHQDECKKDGVLTDEVRKPTGEVFVNS